MTDIYDAEEVLQADAATTDLALLNLAGEELAEKEMSKHVRPSSWKAIISALDPPGGGIQRAGVRLVGGELLNLEVWDAQIELEKDISL